MCNDSNHPLQVDTRNKLGRNTPLHLAVPNNNKKAVELQLKSGGDPNEANVYNVTPLHVTCMKKNDAADLTVTLFDFCDDRQQMVQVDAKEKGCLTPFQWAVAYLHPNWVDILLDHGAKLSTFVFPTSSHLNVRFVTHLDEAPFHTKLKVVFYVHKKDKN
uniref:Uncharacterized protein n=1 Tax=Trichogramma kaykai TaxID=54128 RepID=A0ABD2XMH1_9HYME